jgi:hypothetical protein
MYLKNIFFKPILLLFVSSSIYANFMSLKSDTMVFDERLNQIHAQGNVLLNYNNKNIKTDHLIILVDEELVITSGNISINTDDNSVEPSSLVINLKDEELEFDDIHVFTNLPNQKGKIYVSIRHIISTKKIYFGKYSKFTTCNYPIPHYYLSAWKFHYHPDKSIHLFGAYLKNDLSFFPFNVIPIPIPLIEWVPIPYYYYQLGKRKIVYNFPTIGKKSTSGWGYFIQNQIDYRYENNKSSSIYLDWYEAKKDRKGELGFGINHYYKTKQNNGSFYIYNYNFSQAGESKQNLIYKLNNNFLYKGLKVYSSYKRANIDERINSSGSSDEEFKEFKIIKEDPSFPMSINYSALSQYTNKFDLKTLSYAKSFIHDTINLNFNNNKYSESGRKNQTTQLTHTKQLKYDINLNHNLLYTSNKYTSSDTYNDELLKYETSITKTLPYSISFKLNYNILEDLDENRVTSDLTNGANNYLYKLPEIELSKSTVLFKSSNNLSMKSNSFISFGRYKEVVNTIDVASKTYPQKHVNLEPNVYIFKQSLSKTIKFNFIPKKIQSNLFRYNFRYEQYIFKNKNASLFEGDAQYFLNYDLSYSTTYLKYFKQNINFYRTVNHKDNNSPFYYFNKANTERHELRKTITIFHTKQKTKLLPFIFNISWDNATGYNWLRTSSPYADYLTSLNMGLNNKYKFRISSSKKLNVNYDYNNKPFGPLLISLNGNEPTKFKFNYSLNLDLNEIMFNDIPAVNSSQINFEFPIGKNKEFQWFIKSSYIYKTNSTTKAFDLKNYEYQYISIVKHEHERIIELGYTKLTNELLFKYTFKSFPKDPFTMRRKKVNGKNNWEFEGRLKQASKERF